MQFCATGLPFDNVHSYNRVPLLNISRFNELLRISETSITVDNGSGCCTLDTATIQRHFDQRAIPDQPDRAVISLLTSNFRR